MISKWNIDYRFDNENGPTLSQGGWVGVYVRLQRPKHSMKGNYHLAYNPSLDRFAKGNDLDNFLKRFENQLETRETILETIKRRIQQIWQAEIA